MGSSEYIYNARSTCSLTDDEIDECHALTFQSQKPLKKLDRKHLKELVDFSEEKLREAYSRMNMNSHSWTAKTVSEVDFLCKYLRGTSVLDMGCGHGRHSLELASRGYDVTGIDYVKEHIEDARHMALEQRTENVSFLVDDLRCTRLGNKFDSIICLYDVIGSFPNARDNIKLVKTAYENLKNGGVFILSVMNMELTEKLVNEENKLSVRNNPEALFKLKASSVMQNSGNIFDGDTMIIDTDSGLVYRKEQFDNGSELSAEYIIRDKRYTMDEITKILTDTGFTVIEKRYTHAGFSEFYAPDDNNAKEILVVAEKNNRITR